MISRIDNVIDAQSEYKHLKNKLEMYLQKKEANFEKTQPSSKPLTGVSVNGGTREDKYLNYVISDEELDKKIDAVQEDMKILDAFINKELERMQEYNKWEQQVIFYREKGWRWIQIACRVPFSESTCKRIYRRYKQRRDVDDI